MDENGRVERFRRQTRDSVGTREKYMQAYRHVIAKPPAFKK
jgi:hypothetical protein